MGVKLCVNSADEILQEILEQVERHDSRITPNIEETETVNLGSSKSPKELKIGIGLDQWQRKEMLELLSA